MKPSWMEYNSNDGSGDEIRKALSEIEFVFAVSEPKIERDIFILPRTGKVLPVSKNEFILKYTERVAKGRSHLTNGGEPGTGQESLSPSVSDDPFSLGRKQSVPSGYSYKTAYFHGQKKDGSLFLEKIDDILSERDQDSSKGMRRPGVLLVILFVTIAVLGVAGLIFALPAARDPAARSYALTLALFPIGIAVGGWVFFIGIPGVVAFILEKFFSVDKERAPYIARYILLVGFLLLGVMVMIAEFIGGAPR